LVSAEEILAGVQLADRYQYVLEDASVHRKLGFLTMQAPFTSPRQEILVGFGVPGWQVGTDELPVSTLSVTEFDDLPEAQRTLEHVHRGVGVRLYNTWQGATVEREGFRRIGAYIVGVAPKNIHNGVPMSATGQRFDRIMQRGVVGLSGTKTLARSVHFWQQNVDVGIHSQTPILTEEQRRHRQPPLSDIDERLAVVRNPQIVITKVGEVDLEQLT
jgi:hypothetical protein